MVNIGLMTPDSTHLEKNKGCVLLLIILLEQLCFVVDYFVESALGAGLLQTSSPVYSQLV